MQSRFQGIAILLLVPLAIFSSYTPAQPAQGPQLEFDHNHTFAEVVDYLCDRELLIGSYDPRLVQVDLDDGRRVEALTFVSKPDHPHFAPRLSLEQTVSVVNNARGARGCNKSYVINTVSRMDNLNIRNTELHRVASLLDQPDQVDNKPA